MQRELDAHGSESAAVKAPEALALAQFSEARFHDRSPTLILGARRGLV
jgi:hypothetical protein